MQIFTQILSCFKISSIRLLALQIYNAVKRLPTPWLWLIIHNFPKVHLQRLPQYHYRRKIQYFVWRGLGQKYAQNEPKHAISIEEFIFCGRGPSPSPDSPVGRGTPSPHLTLRPTKPPGSAPFPQKFLPDFRHWSFRSLNTLSAKTD